MRKMFLKTMALLLSLAFLPICLNATGTQEAKSGTVAGEAAAAKTPSPPRVYRVEYTIKEMQDAKTINSRSYTMMAGENDYARIRVGSRVPITVGNEQRQYQDVGMNIDCRVRERENGIYVESRIDSSSIASGEQSAAPVFRNLRTEAQSLVTLGKPVVLNVVDDVVSNRRYEIELTVTRVK
jgi:hypothetical protein